MHSVLIAFWRLRPISCAVKTAVGSTKVESTPMTPVDALYHRSRSRPDRIAFIYRDAMWTYLRLQSEAEHLARALLTRGIRPGDPVLIHLENAPEMLIAWFACAYAGAIAVTTNARASAEELAYFAGHSGAVAALTQPRFGNGACERHYHARAA